MSTVDKGWTIDKDWSDIEALLPANPRGAVVGAQAQVLHLLISTQDPKKHPSRELALEALRSVDWIPDVFIESVDEVLRLGDPIGVDGVSALAESEAKEYFDRAKRVAAMLTALAWPVTAAP